MSIQKVVKNLISRKFILAIFIIILSAIALGLGWISDGSWVAVATLVMAAFGASNVVGKFAEKDDPEEK